jgi:hypothetical protein
MHLYEIDNEKRQLFSAIEDADGEVTIEQIEALDALDGDRLIKLDNILAYVAEVKAKSKALKEESERILALKKSCDGTVAFYENYVKDSLVNNGDKKLELDRFTVSLPKRRDVVVVDVEPEALPIMFVSVKTVKTANKKELMDYHKAGNALPSGVSIEQGKQSLKVK